MHNQSGLKKQLHYIRVELAMLNKYDNTPYEERCSKSVIKTSKALLRYLESDYKDINALWWAKVWREAKEKCVKMVDEMGHLNILEEIARLEFMASQIKNTLNTIAYQQKVE